MNLEIIILSIATQTQRERCHMLSTMCGASFETVLIYSSVAVSVGIGHETRRGATIGHMHLRRLQKVIRVT